MELLIILFLLFGGWHLVVWLGRAGATALPEVSARTRGRPVLEMEVEEGVVGDQSLPVWKVKIRGPFPIFSSVDLSVVISLLDTTDKGKYEPVMASFDEFQEPETRAFQFVRGLGICEPGQGFLHWVDVGVVPKDLLIYPYGGDRKITVIARVIDTAQWPKIQLGVADPRQAGIFHKFMEAVDVHVAHGYLEASQEEQGIAAASIRLGLAVAYADGAIDPLEAKVIKEWSSKFVNEVPAGKGRDAVRGFINDAIRFGNDDARAGSLSISKQVDTLNYLADTPAKYAAMALCLDVMAADGIADQSELRELDRLCDSLDLDPERFAELRDHRMINLKHSAVEGSDVWDILGVSSTLSHEEKKAKLKNLYRRWNSRAESLEDGAEREKAHEMLEMIAQARRLLSA